MSGGRARAALGLMVALASIGWLSTCRSTSGDSGTGVTCTSAGGSWDVALDYGNGLVAHQGWLVEQNACAATITATPPDTTGPSIGGSPAAAYLSADGLFATWTNLAGTCEYSSRLEATVSGATLSGTIRWGRDPYGVGYCPPAVGQVTVNGTR